MKTDEARTLRMGSPREPILRLKSRLENTVLGKAEQIELLLAALLAGGHVLLEDVPGVGKTTLARTLAQAVQAEFGRVQFTPDLLPSDLTGTSILLPGTAQFEFRPGPVFTNVLLADELNRATPRTQSALLEAMEERQVTAEGATRPLPELFFVIATQNPIEQSGVYDLPEAQLDRFLIRLSLGYLESDVERRMVMRKLRPANTETSAGSGDAGAELPCTAQDVLAARAACEDVHVDETLAEYAVALVAASRIHREVVLGASPRASIALLTVARALTWLRGQEFVAPETVQYVAPAVMAHRISLLPNVQLSGRTSRDLVDELVRRVPLPLEV